MTTVFLLLFGIPMLAAGIFALAKPGTARAALAAFPRSVPAGRLLCAAGWAFTAYELDNIGIEVFDRYLKAFPGELWILAAVLCVLMCMWMENLLPIRGLAAIAMLFPAEVFFRIRLDPTAWRLCVVVLCYVCAVWGMFAMFYPWHARRMIAWLAQESAPARIKAAGGILAAAGALFVLGAAFA